MYKTKKEIDAQVRQTFAKLKSDYERNLRGYTFAKFYFKIKEFSTAEQYLCSYLSVKEDNDQAHKLLAQCYQGLKKSEKALQSFQRSLQLNPKQPDVLIEVCQLLLEDKNLNCNKAKYWCELAESEKVQHDAVFSLRLKLMNRDNMETNQVEALIQKEILSKPHDVQLRVRLVRNYVEQNQILDAFKYVHQLEMCQKDEFVNSSEWYNVVWLVLNKYEQMPNTKKDWDFWLILAMCLERQVQISFSLTSNTTLIGGGVTETANLLFQFDQYLYKISQVADKLCAQKEMVELFLAHYRGQLLLHASALIFKRELLQNKNKWKEAVRAALPLLLLAYQVDVPGKKEPWMKHCDEEGKLLISIWQREGSFRCAQAGRTLLSCIQDESMTGDKENAHNVSNLLRGQSSGLWNSSDDLLAQVRQICGDRQWRRNVFAILFCNSDQKVKEQSSLLAKCPKLSEPLYELPTYADIETYEDGAQYQRPQSLQHMVYLCLGNDNLAYVRAKYFSGLNFSTQNLLFCGAESLNQLDVESFLYAAAIQAKRALEVDREAFDNYQTGNSYAAGRPKILPFVNLQQLLCTEEQSQWWNSAYLVYKNLSSGHNLAELRATLQYGIEAVRGINGPKLDMAIVFKLGQIFVARAQDIVKPVEKAFLEARAESIYKYGLNMMKMHNKGVLEPFRKYFKYAKANSSVAEREVFSMAEDAVSYLASRYFKKSEYEDLIDELSGIQLPFATYLQAEAYRKLDEASKTPRKTKRIYLDRANECLNQTLVLLRSSAHADPNHPLNSVIHNEIRRLQQSTARYLNESSSNNFSPIAGLNNSSTYEDAEADFNAESSLLPTPSLMSQNRSRRETMANNALLVQQNHELEALVKQMASTLTLLKEEIIETLKPELHEVTKEITVIKDKISNLEDAMKKVRISSNPPSRDDASNVLDDLYIIEESLQQQMYQQQQQQQHTPNQFGPNSMPGGAAANMMTNSPFMAQQQRLQAAAAYNSPMFPPTPNYPMNFYGHSQPYMMTPQSGPPGINQRNPGLPTMPYLDPTVPPGAMNFSMPPQSNPLLPPPTQPPNMASDPSRPSSLYNLLQQPPVPITPSTVPPSTMPPFSTPLTHSLAVPPPIAAATSVAPSILPPTTTITFNKLLNNQPVEKGPPANVVITSSDPLPNPHSISLQSQQTPLSVTIPSHHIKPSLVSQQSDPFVGQSVATTVQKPAASTVATTSSTLFGSSITSSTFSFKPHIAAAAAQSSANLSSEGNTYNKTSDSIGSDFNKSGGDDVEYDPRPDFKPIIALPDEVEVRTGEEDEEVMFCHRAKLFRFVDKDWKERGIGDIKILKNKEGSSRILMRRDQTHKICANHKIIPEITMTVPKSDTSKCFIWAAHDFADEEVRLEKFLVRFKLPETAKQFQETFKKAQEEAESLTKKDEEKSNRPVVNVATAKPPAPFSLAKSTATNFATSTPSQKGDIAESQPKPVFGKPLAGSVAASNAPTATAASKSLFSGLNLSTKTPSSDVAKATSTSTVSPFATFSFGTSSISATSSTTTTTSSSTTASPFASIFSNLNKSTTSTFGPTAAISSSPSVTSNDTSVVVNKSNVSDAEDDYVPTAQFNPVIALPELVEVTTGEENETVLFEHRAKLLRFDKEAGEWKERGLGNIKLLQDKTDANKVRLVMRREQVHKLCCNQRIYKDTHFKYIKNSQTAVSWAGQDYSENELVTEMLTVRFKLPETCKQFLDAIENVQAKMSGNGTSASEDKQAQKKSEESKATTKGFGDAFKPKAGSWSCKDCYTSNTAETLYCVACDCPKDDTVPKKEVKSNILAPSGKTTFSFGFAPAAQTASTASSAATNATSKPPITFGMPPISSTNGTSAASSTLMSTKTDATKPTVPKEPNAGFGDAFKPKAGSWTCEGCYLSNAGDAIYCKACDAPKDSTVPKKETNTSSVLALSNPAQKFSFGFNAAATATSSESATKPQGGFSFGSTPVSAAGDSSASFSFAPPTATSTGLGSVPATTTQPGSVPLGKSTFSFSLSSTALESPAMPSSASATTTQAPPNAFSLDKKEFSFTLKPKSPGKSGKSPLKLGGGDADADDDGDGEYHEEEENNTYFTPVIALPDKIEVKTGEEDEDLLYIHRAKLYRFTEGEWKERGLGNVKILRHKLNKKLRVVMRREQVLKICLNHVLNDDVDYKRKDEKSWLFVVNDFSEGAVELEQFSLRFKTKEIAEAFMDIVKKALDGTAEAIETPANTSITTPTNTAAPSSVLNISDEDKRTADKLKLPYEFFTAKPTCAGCRGCDPDQFVFASDNKGENFVHQDDIKNPLEPMEFPALNLLNKSANRTILKQSTLSPLSAKTEKESTKINESIFSGFGGANSTTFGEKPANATFSFVAALNSTSKPAEEAQKTTAGSGGFLFGSGSTLGNNSAATGASIFSGAAPENKSAFGIKTNLFGNVSSTTNDSAADAHNPEKTATKSIFGGTATGTSSGSIFGGKAVFGSQSPAFGTPSLNDTTKSIFGSSNNTTQSIGSGNSIFGSSMTSNATNSFGGLASNTNQGSIFGSNTAPFGTASKDLKTGSATPFVDLSKTSTAAIDFASIAAKADSESVLGKSTSKPGPGGFIGLTNQDAFSSFSKPLKESDTSAKNTSTSKANESQKSVDGGEGGEENDENYDPHYDPIIELPNEIVVSTGEEEETKLFGERAKLYRFDATNKEWKERGVGELKLLAHPAKKTYRLVMRREKIHKLVLNHAITGDFHFSNMNNSPQSFVWATMNYAESGEGELEKLAVRFSKVELAECFSSKLKECIEKCKQNEG
ncbi:E3 SUMO-protein ligase RanBP2 isoform X1 [Stomoxys calcitrans]|uniref:E3 SUMO-protein ligase RanBP2 isoform X1 n=1 Tax=Stomoxys calcitrans TaxID=35570 RepID=UPI0027E2E4FF|nr:E3 SUMO-protein ligase RanBP2 isoform X1 [Stomoxys calcitrans]